MNRRIQNGVLALVCAVATLVASFTQFAIAESRPNRLVRGLAPSPSGRAVQADRPPGARSDESGPSLAIFPAQQISIRFNHKLHVRELGQSCVQCHEAANTSRKSSDLLLPAPATCDRCHQTDHRQLQAVRSLGDDPSSQCAYCHLGYRDGSPPVRQVFPAPNLVFDHAAHAARNIGCAQCHGQVQNVELATRDQLPRMAGCLRCHGAPAEARGDARGECTTCHVTDGSGLLRQHFPSGVMMPPRWMNNADHDPDFLERHKLVAGQNSELCANCHKPDECVACHDGRVRPRSIHPNDWLNLHAVSAQQLSSNCMSCHHEQTFCVSCHQRAGVAMSGSTQRERGRFHPPASVWTDLPRTSQHHAAEASRNLAACVSCHVERDCVICHGTQVAGGRAGSGSAWSGDTNPHAPGFASRCRAPLRENARACLVCHHPADPSLELCR